MHKQFSDSRTAYEDLSKDMKDQLENVVAAHSLFHSRKTVMPEHFKDLDPSKKELSRHKLVQTHEWSGRKVEACVSVLTSAILTVTQNLYIASYVHHLENMSPEESRKLIDELTNHISKPRYRLTIDWIQNGDMIIWGECLILALASRHTDGSRQHQRNASCHRWLV
jgi:alpha-ketoglutarate-dependent 2,4-dichlorophenoxyacetate dioxygenase